MSKVSNNSNYNKVSVKTDSTVELIQELSKLGVFKEKRKPRKRASTVGGDIRQDGPMPPGFTKNLGGPQMRNLPPIQQITPGLTQNQIEDIQRSNDAVVSALRAEVEQHRSETQQLNTGVSRLANLAAERFRGAQEPGAGQRPNPFIQSTTIEELPDTTEKRFTETLNEGAPEAVEQAQEKLYAGGELPEGIPFLQIGDIIPEPRIQPQEKIGGAPRKTKSLSLRKAVTDYYKMKPIPKFTDTNTGELLTYYRELTNKTGYSIDETIFRSKEKLFKAINEIVDELALTPL
jgi:hypothetical protein